MKIQSITYVHTFNMKIEILYTHEQVEQMMKVAHSYALNNPSGDLPKMPQPKYMRAETPHWGVVCNPVPGDHIIPEQREPHRVIRFLKWIKVL